MEKTLEQIEYCYANTHTFHKLHDGRSDNARHCTNNIAKKLVKLFPKQKIQYYLKLQLKIRKEYERLARCVIV